MLGGAVGLSVSLLLGCAHHKAQRDSVDAQPAIAAYSSCTEDAGRRLAGSGSTAYEIADAALSECEASFVRMNNAVRDYMWSQMSGGSDYDNRMIVSDQTRKTVEELRHRARERVIGVVVEARAH